MQPTAEQRVGDSSRAQMPGVAWRRSVGLRNILAHGYEQVEHETLYRTVHDDLAAVEAAPAAWLAAHGDG